jgi:hypothetical protein
LKVQVEQGLKRLASAVQLRPWPPHFKAVKSIFHSNITPQLPAELQKFTSKDRTTGSNVYAQAIANQPWQQIPLNNPEFPFDSDDALGPALNHLMAAPSTIVM